MDPRLADVFLRAGILSEEQAARLRHELAVESDFQYQVPPDQGLAKDYPAPGSTHGSTTG